MTGQQDSRDRLRRRYGRFAEREACGVSPLYESFSLAVCDHDPTLDFLADLPVEKQQPNLLFAAVRAVAGVPEDGRTFLDVLTSRADDVRAVMLEREVQTNEPGRCAALLPLLSRLRQPIALIELGAAAGLCLLPDRYRYAFGTHRLSPPRADPGTPEFPCEADSLTPLPDALPEIAWRLGIDRHPVDLDDPNAVAWLEALVWPEESERAARLRAAIRVARRERPVVHQRDLRDPLDDLIAAAPADSTVVVLHSAVASYLPSREAVDAFAARMRSLPVTWVSNEAPAVFPEISIPSRYPEELTKRSFLLAVDGEPIALTGPHGQYVKWFE